MGERSNVVFRNIRVQQPVRTLEPFGIAERTARRVDPMADLLAGARFGGLLGSIAGQRESRNMAKLERETFEEQRQRSQQIRDIANQSVAVDPDTGRLALDPDNFKAGLLAGGFGQEALQMQQAEDAQAVQQALALQKMQADMLEAQARMMQAQRGPTVRRTIDERAAMGDPVAQEAVAARERRRQESRLETQRQLVDITTQQARARRREEREFQAQLPVAEGMASNATRIFDTETGQLIDQGMPTQEARRQIRQGRARILDQKQANALSNAQAAIEPVRRLRELMVSIYGQGGIFDRLQAEGRVQAGARGALARLFQTDPDLVEAQRLIDANVDSIRRAFQGQVGTQTEQDARRGLQSLPRLTGIPDTRNVAFRNMNNVMNIVNRIYRTYLGNRDFQLEGLEQLRSGEQVPDVQSTLETRPGEAQETPAGTVMQPTLPASARDPLGIR